MKLSPVPRWIRVIYYVAVGGGIPTIAVGIGARVLRLWSPSMQESVEFESFCALVFFIVLCAVVRVAKEEITDNMQELSDKLDRIENKLDQMRFEFDAQNQPPQDYSNRPKSTGSFKDIFGDIFGGAPEASDEVPTEKKGG